MTKEEDMSEQKSWTDATEVRCPMPVIREDWDAIGDEVTYLLGVCGEPLYIVFTGTGSLYGITDDPADGFNAPDAKHPDVATWDLECSGRHRLLVSDCEDRSVPYSADLARAAFDALAASSPLGSRKE